MRSCESSSSSTRKLLGRVPLRLRSDEDYGRDEKRHSAYESCQLASTIGLAEESRGWEVEVTRAVIASSLVPKKEIGVARGSNLPRHAPYDALPAGAFRSPDTHFLNNDNRPPSKIPRRSRSPFSSLDNTISSMPAAHTTTTDKVPPQSPVSAAQGPLSVPAGAQGRGRPTITPASLSSRRQAATTRSFSSIPPGPPQISTATIQSGPSLLAPPTLSVIGPTPDASPITPSTPSKRTHHKSDPETPSSALRKPGPDVPQVQKSWSTGSGKRKAEEIPEADTTPPTLKEQKEHRATFAPEPRTHRASASSHAPSSYHRKRARLSVPSDSSNPPSRPPSRNATMSSVQESPAKNAKSTGSWSSKKSQKSFVETLRRAGSASTTPSHARNDSWTRPGPQANGVYPNGPSPSRRSLSQASIPISALISPHAPSIGHSGTYHMRDPRKPAPVQNTTWSLSLPSRVDELESRWDTRSWVERGGSPLCAWFFFVGFVVFPLWWVASFTGVPKTRRLPGGLEAGGREKGVILDDPQVEYDVRSWRRRCRIMSSVSLISYIPFIVLVIVFAR